MEELVRKAKEGDEEAFTQLIINLETDMYKIAKIRLNNESNVEDAVQETIFEIFKSIKKLKKNEYFKTWVIKVLINKCNKIYRKNEKEKISIEEIELDKYYISGNKNYEIDSKVDFFILLKKLNYNERIAITLYYLNDFTNEQISKILNIPISTVKNRISRARKKLKDRIGESYNGIL